MTVKSEIREALRKIMAEGDANACDIWTGYDVATDEEGWHYVPFGATAVYLGKNKAEALETIREIADDRDMYWE